MAGLKRRKRVEGWALDASETDNEVGRATIVQRLAENNKLWIACLIAVLALTFLMIKTLHGPAPAENGPQLLPALGRGHYDDSEHTKFARDFVSSKQCADKVLDARFESAEVFRLDMSSNVSKDDVDFVAKLAGLKIVHDFHYRPIVHVYWKNVSGESVHVAAAKWQPKAYGFVVDFDKAAK